MGREQLQKNGYVNLTTHLSKGEFEICESLMNQLKIYPEMVGGPMKYFEYSKKDRSILLNRVEFFLEVSEDFSNLIEEKFLPLLKTFTGKDYILFKEKINFKMAGAGGFKAHQDAPAFKKFIDEEMFTIMIPLQKTTLLNGCLYVSRKFNNLILPHIKGSIPEDYTNDMEWVPIAQEKRDILVFSSYLVHSSQENHSNFPRQCYFLTFNPKKLGNLRKQYFDFKRKNFPPRVERTDEEKYKSWQDNLAREIF